MAAKKAAPFKGPKKQGSSKQKKSDSGKSGGGKMMKQCSCGGHGK